MITEVDDRPRRPGHRNRYATDREALLNGESFVSLHATHGRRR